MVAPVLRSRLLSGSTTRESVPLKTPGQLQHKCTMKLIISTSNRIVLSHKHSDILIYYTLLTSDERWHDQMINSIRPFANNKKIITSDKVIWQKASLF